MAGVRPEQKQYPQGLRLFTVLLCLALGTFLVAIDTVIISVAIPRISTQFQAANDVGWYGSAYLLTLTALQPAVGTLYKLFNVKGIYLICITIFEAGSIVCAIAPSSSVFIIGRAIAGIGAAGVISGGLNIITLIAPLEKRPVYIGLIVSTFGISTCSSPILGGVLTDRLSWRWCFWINVPIGVAVVAALFFSLKFDSQKEEGIRYLSLKEKLGKLDPIGVVLIVGAVCCLLLALQWGGDQYSWRSARIIVLLIAFVGLLSGFGVSQWYGGENATIPLRLLSQRTVLFGSLASFFISMSMNVKLYYLPFFFQAVQGVSAIESGVRFLPLAVPQVVAVALAGGVATQTGHYIPVMLAGQVLAALGTGLLVMLNISTTTVAWAAFMVLAGFGDGLCMNIPYIAVQSILEKETDVMVGNAIATFFTLIGGAIAVSIGNTLLLNTLISEVSKYTSTITGQEVLAAGALNLPTLTSSPTVLLGLREAYAKAVSATTISATVAACISILMTFGMQWLNLKEVVRKREEEAKAVGSEKRQSIIMGKDVEWDSVAAYEEHEQNRLVHMENVAFAGPKRWSQIYYKY
ncbi:hypothetical protein MMC25_000995 [Agyrium rufum]|nr:hypothetical protein [Agyrium rufum]